MKKKLHWKSFLLGVLSVILVFALALPALGAGGTLQTWTDVLVGGINIILNGQAVQPRDAKGNAVDPVIYNGTTYLPVRAIASALDLDVGWDGGTKTVYLETKPVSGYSWVLTGSRFELDSPLYPETYQYSYDGRHDGMEWLKYVYHEKSGKEFTDADVYFGCETPPAVVLAGGKVAMKLTIRVENFAGYSYDGSYYVPVSSTYIKAGYGPGNPLKDENGETHLWPVKSDTIVVTGNLDKTKVFTGMLPESKTVGDTMEISFHCDAGVITWTYTLQYN